MVAPEGGVSAGLDGGAGGDPLTAAACNIASDCAQVLGREVCDRQRGICVECLTDQHCARAERCIQRQCEPERSCDTSLDCSLGAVCDDADAVCVECSADSDCEPGAVCAQAHCEPRCDSDKDCTPIGMLCDMAAGHCDPSSTSNQEPAPAHPPDAGGVCASSRVNASRVLASIMFLVDGSSSMEQAYGVTPDAGTAPVSAPVGMRRWDAIRDALVAPATGAVYALAGKARFGLAVFGSEPTCPLPLPVTTPALGNADALAASLPSAPPGLHTPTGPALDQIADLLPDGEAAGAGPQIIVLATDGEPNACGADVFTPVVTDYAPSLAAAMKARAKHQKLFVFSVAAAAGEFAAHLQQMANIGAGLDPAAAPGAKVFYPDDSTSLSDTLLQLISDQLPCEFALDRGIMAGRECSGSVTLNGSPLECQGQDGWELIDATHIRLKGLACASLSAADALFQVDIPCNAQL